MSSPKLNENDFSAKTIEALDNSELSVEIEEKLTNLYTIATDIDCKLKNETELKSKLVESLQKIDVDVNEDDDLSTIFSIISNIKTVIECTAVAEDVVEGKTFTNLDGELVTGTMKVYNEMNIDVSGGNQVIPTGYYTNGVNILGDSNLIPSNIRSGVSIFGVTGTANFASIVTTSTNIIYKYYNNWLMVYEGSKTLYTWTCPYQGKINVRINAAAAYVYDDPLGTILYCYKNGSTVRSKSASGYMEDAFSDYVDMGGYSVDVSVVPGDIISFVIVKNAGYSGSEHRVAFQIRGTVS